jgi:GH15 family glucan-1,4-alpha-glucosidase
VLSEQLDTYTSAPVSVSPLTWSHATVVSLVHEYVLKRKALVASATTRLSDLQPA